ncbi:MAG: SusC/RagA family TonB-linked outer membrane protein, partial [Chitinophagaceae bacterium]
MRRVLRLLVASLLFLFLLPPALMAQERTITGTVLSDNNKTPLPGVTVMVKGTSRKTQTDASGNFSIRINAGETLQFTYVGHETRDVKPDGNTVSISMKSADAMLGEVVVTAMDIKRNPRELGYSVQKVTGDEIKESQRDNFLNSLQGRVAGLTINQTSGLAGASSSIVLRGFNSMALDNQPLFVIDGVIS